MAVFPCLIPALVGIIPLNPIDSEEKSMKKYSLLFLLTALVLCMLTGCRGGNQATTPMTTVPTTQATTIPTTTAATEPSTQDTTPTTDNGNGPMMTEETQESTRQTNGTTMVPTEKDSNR